MDIAAVAEQLNFPGLNALKKELRKRGIQFDPKEVERFVASDATRQPQRGKYDFGGKIVSNGLHKRWFLDLIDFTATPSDGGKRVGLNPTEAQHRYILCAQDVFSRMLWTEALKNKRPETVLSAFRSIMDRAKVRPESIQTDGGAEWGALSELELSLIHI